MKKNLNEINKIIKHYQFSDRYEADEHGNIFILHPSKYHKHILTGHKLKSYINNYGYVEYNVFTENGYKHIQAHRVAALLFIFKPTDKNYVNHIDGNKLNNNISNLEWCTSSENEIHSHSILGKKAWNKGKTLPSGKQYRGTIRPVSRYSLDMVLEKKYFNPKDAEQDGYSLKQISAACNGNQKTHKNKIWRYNEK